MKLRIHPHAVIALLFSVMSTLSALDVDALSRSPIWQVRYCVPLELRDATPEVRTILERLACDENTRVAGQAFGVYSRMFVDLEKVVVRKAFDRGELFLGGITSSDRDEFVKPDFWLWELKEAKENPELQARAIRALGLIGDGSVIPKLPDLGASENPWVLTEVAVAYRRLGNNDVYLGMLDRVLGLPTEKNILYQTRAIECLIQTHPERSRAAWARVDKEVAKHSSIQPNWMFAHVLQKERLP